MISFFFHSDYCSAFILSCYFLSNRIIWVRKGTMFGSGIDDTEEKIEDEVIVQSKVSI